MKDEWLLKFRRKLTERPFEAAEDPIDNSPSYPQAMNGAGTGTLIIDLYSRLRPSLSTYLTARGLSKEHSEDVIQEAFLRLVRANVTLSMGDNPRAWVFRVAHNLAMDHYRSQKRRQMGSEIEVHLALHYRADPAPDPEQMILNEERFRTLQSAFSRLTPKQRDCLRLRAKGLRYQEIALVMGVSVQRVGELMQRAISRVELESLDNSRRVKVDW